MSSQGRFLSAGLSIGVLLCQVFFLAGCGGSDAAPAARPALPAFPPAVVEDSGPPPKAEIPKYVYRGERFTDPFIPLSATERSSLQDELIIPNINSLSLRGIYTAGGRSIALLADAGRGYTVRGNRLYDARDRQIPGFWCSIKAESVAVAAGGVTREIKIRE